LTFYILYLKPLIFASLADGLMKKPRLITLLLLLIPWLGFAQLSFNANPSLSNGTIDLCLLNSSSVFFQSAYNGPAPDSIIWSFPGGSPSSRNGIGNFNISYTNTGLYPSGVIAYRNGLVDTSINFTVRVYNIDPVSFNPSQTTFCANDPALSLDGFSPPGGTFSGNGVSGNIFRPGVAGVGTHTVTYTVTSGNCSVSRSASFTVNAIPPGNAATNISNIVNFQGEDVYTKCFPSNGEFRFYSSDPTASYTKVYIDYGDGSPVDSATTFDLTNSKLHTFLEGIYTVTFTFINANGCQSQDQLKVFFGSVPQGGITSFGSTQGCLPTDGSGLTYAFAISNVANNPPGTIYKVTFSNDSLTRVYQHPPPDTIFQTFYQSSCGFNSPNELNAFRADLMVVNPCDSLPGSIGGIKISESANANFVISDTCSGDSIRLLDLSNGGRLQFQNCDTVSKIIWKITPTTGVIFDPSEFGFDFGDRTQAGVDGWIPGVSEPSIIINRPGTYYLTQYVGNSSICGVDSITKSVCIDSIPKPNFALSDSTICAGDIVDLHYLERIVPYCDSTKLTWEILNQSGWAITNGTFQDSSLKVVFNNTGRYSIALKAENPCGESYDTLFLDVIGQPIVQLPPDTTLCGLIYLDFSDPNLGFVVEDSAGVSTFSWSVTPATGWSYLNGTNANSAQPYFDFTAYGTYTINLNYSNGCFSRVRQMIVSVNAPPQLDSISDTTLCYDANYAYTFSAQFGNHPLIYSWRTLGTGLQAGNSINLSNLRDSTQVWVYARDQAGCWDSSSFWIYIPDPINVTISAPDSLCYNDTLPISTAVSGGMGYYRYQWLGTNVSHLSSDTIANPVIDSTGIPGQYILRVTDSMGCIGYDTISIAQHPKLIVDAGPDESACNTANSLALLNASPLGGAWTGNHVSNNGVFNPIAAGLGAHVVYYHFTDSRGCDYTDSLTVNVVSPPVASFNLSDSIGCPILSVNVSSSSDPSITHFWYLNDSLLGSSLNFTLNLDNPSATQDLVYDLKLILSASGQNCEDSLTKRITVYPKPQAIFNLPSVACANDTLSLSHSSVSKGGSLDSLRWLASSVAVNILDPTANSTSIVFPDNQSSADSVYTISLIVYSRDGCSDTLSQNITIHPRPTANFTIPANACGPFILQASDNSLGQGLNYNWSISPIVAGSGLNTANPSFNIPASTSDSALYRIFLSISDTNGCADTFSQKFTLYPNPTAAFNLSRQDSCGPLNVRFTNLSNSGQSGMDTTTLSFQWDLGNGTTSNANTPAPQTYLNNGLNDTTYYITLIITNAFGCSDTLTDSVIIRADPIAQFVLTDTVNCAPFLIDSTIVKSAQLQPNSNYYWQAFDLNGNPIPNTNFNGANAFNYIIQNDKDSIIVRLVVEGPNGCAGDTISQLFYTIEDPVANFAALPDSGCSPLFIQLSDSSTAGVSHQWFVNDQAFSTSANPNITLINNSSSQDSIVQIKLVVTAGTGCTDTLSQSVRIFPKPQAQFTISPTACANDTLSLNHSSSFKGSSLDSLRWLVSSSAATILDPAANSTSIIFPDNQSGNDSVYTISLIVYSSDGCSDTLSQNITVHSRPTADFSIPSSSCGPFTLQPSDNSSGPGLIYNWSILPLVSGTGLSSPNPSFNIPASQSDSVEYFILLSISDANGCIDTSLKRFVLYPNPSADFNLSSRDSCGPLTVAFTNLSSSGQSGMDTSTLTFQWDLGNGSTSTANTPAPVTYTNTGINDTTYYISLITTNAFGCSDTLQDSVIVRADPAAQMNISNSVDCAPFLINSSIVNAQQLPPNNTYTWRILDLNGNLIGSNTFSGPNGINYTINNDGDSVIVQLIVSSLHGCLSDTLNQLFYTIEDPVANFATLPNAGCSPLFVQLSDSSTAGVSHQWFLNDQAFSSLQNPSITLLNNSNTQDSIFTIKLVITAGTGCTDTLSRQITVYPKPQAQFMLNPVACARDTLSLSHSSISKGNQLDSLRWLASSNNISILDPTAATTSIIFPDNQSGNDSVYTISLIVYSSDGCSDTLSQNITVYSRPTANFSIPANACGPYTLQPANNSIGPGLNYSWSIDSAVAGTGLNTANPSFFIPVSTNDSAVYRVFLLITDANGCSDTSSQLFTLYPKPQAAFALSNQDSCGPLTVAFTNLSSSGQSRMDTTTLSFQWNLGNGSTYTANTPAPISYTNTGINDTTYYISLIATNAFGCRDTLLDSVIVRADPLAQMNISNSVDCAPFVIDSSVVNAQQLPPNDTYTWRILDLNGNLIGSNTFSGPNGINYTINNDGDSVIIQLIVSSPHGCSSDTLNQLFYTIEDPVANFATLPSAGCSPLLVQLSDSSSAGVSHQWFLNDQAFSTLQNPSLSLVNNSTTQDSVFNIKLVVTAGTGCTDTLIKQVTVYPKPQAAFSLPAQACANDTLLLSHSSSFKGLSLDSLQWTVSSSAVQIVNPSADSTSIIFPDNQSGSDSTYTISLIVYSSDGCSDTLSQNITIHSRPTANFSIPANACGPYTLQPANNSTGPGLNYAWSIDSAVAGTGLTTANPSFFIPVSTNDSMVYRVFLLITDANGCSDTSSQKFTLYPKPQAAFALSNQDSCGPLTVAFTNLSSSGQSGMDTSTLSFQWDLGNGSTSSANTPAPVTYTNTGINDTTYYISLITTNAFGCSDTLVDSVIVRANPFAYFTASTVLECAPFTIDTSIVTWIDYPLINAGYRWEILNLQDSILSFGTDPNTISYTILQPADSVKLRLIAFSLFGCANDTLEMGFQTIPNPVPNFTITNPQGCSPHTLTIVDSSSAGVTYEWFVDGQLVSTSPNPAITLTNSGRFIDSVYTIKLIVTAGGTGCRDSIEHTATVFALPEANFSVNPVCEGDTLYFTDLSTSIDTVVSWFWDFGDGTIDSVQNPQHRYASYGWQSVSLTVSDSRGCSHTFSDSVLVYPNPIALIAKSGNCEPQNICKGQSVSLLDSSFVDSLGAPINSWAWDVDGDGIIDYNVQNPNHSFSDTGSTSVTLYVQTIYGCTDSISLTFNVLDLPSIDFDFDTTANCGPLTVNLINQSTGRIDFSEWTVYTLDSLGNRQIMLNDTSRFLNSSITLQPSYRSDTIYYFELISGNCCGSDTLTKTIQLKPLPVAAMLASSDEGCTPFPVTFQLDGLVTGKPDFLILNYGDGRIDTLLQSYFVNSFGDTIYVWGQQNHTFINSGNVDTTFTVSLTAVNECGDSTVTIDILVHPNAVQAFFQSDPVNGCEDLDVNFQDFSFGATNVSWCFDYDTLSQSCNQPVAIGTSFTHTYTQAGTYVVAQFVDDGCSYDTAFQIITVYPAPVANFNSNNFLCEGDTVFFSDQSAANGAAISSYTWYFGDGDSSYLTNPFHVYDTAGTFNVKLVISSANGCKDSSIQVISIYDKPNVDFGYSNACFNEQPIFFSDSTTLNSGTIVSTEWDFGDGNTSTSLNPQHSYQSPGLYRVSLIKISSNGCIDSAFYNVNVFPEPRADFRYNRLSPDSCSVPQLIEFINQSQNAQGFLWDFDYGNNPGQFTSTLVNPQFTYTSYGVYDVALFTTNSFGCSDTIIKTIQVSPVPNAGFTADTLEGCEPLAVNFTDTSTYNFNGPGGINQWLWDFGDGNTSTSSNPTHIYVGGGSYQTRLIVTTDAGCSDTVLGPIINVYPRPIADFNIQVLNASEIQLVNNSLNTDSTTRYFWTFGDGNTSTEANPSHRYRFDLTQGDIDLQVCLRLESAYGCADSLCQDYRLRSLQLNVPNALAPEVEVGSDANVFLPKGHSLKDYTLRIYDKWGNIVFESTALDEEGKPVEAWDGTHYINGSPLPMGSYTWRIDAVFNDGTVWFGKEYRNGTKMNVGSVTLIR